MAKFSMMRVVVKDLIDFCVVFLAAFLSTLGVYSLLPSFTQVDLSFYFFEQFVELFFVNPELVLWLLAFGLGFNVIYFLICFGAFRISFGGLVAGLRVSGQSNDDVTKPFKMAVGSFIGVLALGLSPLSAWWLDRNFCGWSEKWAGILYEKRSAASPADDSKR